MRGCRVCVVGLGYIGLPTASFLATKGFRVHGVDVEPRTVELINRGEIPIHEPGLDVLVKAAVSSGRLVAASEPAPADVYVVAVPTPISEGHEPDISYVEQAARAIAPHLAPGNLVVLESTSPVGTTEKLCEWLAGIRPDLHFPARTTCADPPSAQEQVYVVHCPERVLPGQILKELVENDRVIGGVDRPSTEKAQEFYSTFVGGHILLTDARTAEMCKLTENAFRDVNIAFANELSLICEQHGIDVWELIALANRHPRVSILRPGPGVGGHCIAVDPWFIVASAPEASRVIRTAREVNDGMPAHVAGKVKAKAARFQSPVIACLGLAFKADVDDLRESPAVKVVAQLAADRVGRVLVVEPHVSALPPELTELGVELTDLSAALATADIVVLLVDHRPFHHIPASALHDKVLIDTRGVWR